MKAIYQRCWKSMDRVWIEYEERQKALNDYRASLKTQFI